MTMYVVDASVAMRWFVTKNHTDDALRLRNPDDSLHIPALFDIEMANIFWKKVQQGEIQQEDAAAIVTTVVQLPLNRLRCCLCLTVHSCFSSSHRFDRWLLTQMFGQERKKRRTGDLPVLLVNLPIGGQATTGFRFPWPLPGCSERSGRPGGQPVTVPSWGPAWRLDAPGLRHSSRRSPRW